MFELKIFAIKNPYLGEPRWTTQCWPASKSKWQYFCNISVMGKWKVFKMSHREFDTWTVQVFDLRIFASEIFICADRQTDTHTDKKSSILWRKQASRQQPNDCRLGANIISTVLLPELTPETQAFIGAALKPTLVFLFLLIFDCD